MTSLHETLSEFTATSELFSLTRSFRASRDLVWRAWTQQEHLRHWFGPPGFTMKDCSMDFRSGGLFHYHLVNESGLEMWAKWKFQDIDPQYSFTFILSFSDAQGGTKRHFASETWPLYMRVAVTFTETGGTTYVTLINQAVNADEVETRTFNEGLSGMSQGFGAAFDQLEAYLPTLR